jgi:hypothetical protein
MSKWFANKLALNLDKTNIIKFTTINLPQCPLSIGYNDKYIKESVQTKFLGLQIDNSLSVCVCVCVCERERERELCDHSNICKPSGGWFDILKALRYFPASKR